MALNREDDSDSALRVLFLGEGNLSFAHAVVKKLSVSSVFKRYQPHKMSPAPPAPASAPLSPLGRLRQRWAHLMVTTFDTLAQVTEKYPESLSTLQYFSTKSRVWIEVIGGVNATDIQSSLSSAHDRGEGSMWSALSSTTAAATVCSSPQSYHLIIFNNPHIGVEDAVRHRSLLSHFFASSLDLFVPKEASLPTQVVVALCDGQAQRWDLFGAAQRAGLVCMAAVPVNAADFPPYVHRRHQNASAFPYQCMVQYYFLKYTDCPQLVVGYQHLFSTYKDLLENQLTEWEAAVDELQGAHQTKENETVALPPWDAVELEKDWEALDVKSFESFAFPVEAESLGSFIFPLLHPSLAFFSPSDDVPSLSPGHTQRYCPYILPERLLGLLTLQLRLMQSFRSHRTGPSFAPTAPAKTVSPRPRVTAHPSVPQASIHGTGLLHIVTGPHDRSNPACAICGLTFVDEEAYQLHLYALSPERPLPACEVCCPVRQFVDERALKQHQLRWHADLLAEAMETSDRP